MGVVDGPSYPLDTLIGGDGAQGGARVEVVEAEAQGPAAAQLIHQHGLALLINICEEPRITQIDEMAAAGYTQVIGCLMSILM